MQLQNYTIWYRLYNFFQKFTEKISQIVEFEKPISNKSRKYLEMNCSNG